MQELKVRTRVKAFQRDAHDVGKWPTGGPQRAVRDKQGRQMRHENGKPVIERLPSAGSVLMLNPAGSSVHMPLHCGSGRPKEDDPYFRKVSREKLKKGFLPMEGCPKAFGLQEHFHEDFPADDLHTAPCKVTVSGKVLGEKEPRHDDDFCACIMLERDLRRGVSAQLVEGINARYRNKHMLDIASRDAQTDALLKSNKAIIEALQSGGDERVVALEAKLAELTQMLTTVMADKGKKK